MIFCQLCNEKIPTLFRSVSTCALQILGTVLIGQYPIDVMINWRGNWRFLDGELTDFNGTIILL